MFGELIGMIEHLLYFCVCICLKQIIMKRILSCLSFSVVLLLTAVHVSAQQKDVVDVVIGSAAHTTLVTAVKSADLVATLKGKGPFTVFAPTNDAFSKLPAGTVDALLKPENKATLAGILTYHVVAGKLMASDILAAVKKGKGKTILTTVNGQKLTVTLEGGKVKITDAKGGVSYVTSADIDASNGVVHVVDAVLLPK
jgi:uncharacterized surface protein with fasciclin (FAS1) repeats